MLDESQAAFLTFDFFPLFIAFYWLKRMLQRGKFTILNTSHLLQFECYTPPVKSLNTSSHAVFSFFNRTTFYSANSYRGHQIYEHSICNYAAKKHVASHKRGLILTLL